MDKRTILWVPEGEPTITNHIHDVELRVRPVSQIMVEATEIMRAGGIVAFPTETVYGLGASSLNAQALDAIFVAKNRPRDNPLISHVSSISQLSMLTPAVQPMALRFMRRFWPGPLSILFDVKDELPEQLTAGLAQAAVRMPNHPLALSLIATLGQPIAAPSANLSGRPSPTTAEHVLTDLSGRIDGVIAGGAAKVGIESTVIAVENGRIVILRPGQISAEELSSLGYPVVYDPHLEHHQQDVLPRAPGQKYRHYAPEGELTVVTGTTAEVRAYIQQRVFEANTARLKVGVLTLGETAYEGADLQLFLGLVHEPDQIANRLYGALRDCDEASLDLIFAEGLPDTGRNRAIVNRLYKASGGRMISL